MNSKMGRGDFRIRGYTVVLAVAVVVDDGGDVEDDDDENGYSYHYLSLNFLPTLHLWTCRHYYSVCDGGGPWLGN